MITKQIRKVGSKQVVDYSTLSRKSDLTEIVSDILKNNPSNKKITVSVSVT